MPPFRPFPVPSLSIGTDIAHVPRIAKLVASKETLPRFLRKVLTSREERDFHLRFPQDVSDDVKSEGGVSKAEERPTSLHDVVRGWQTPQAYRERTPPRRERYASSLRSEQSIVDKINSMRGDGIASTRNSYRALHDLSTLHETTREARLRSVQDAYDESRKSDGISGGKSSRAVNGKYLQDGPSSSESESAVGESDYGWVDKAARYLAGRWAAKEAVVKACSWRKLTFDEIQILKDDASNRIYGVILDRPQLKDTRAQWERKRDTLKESPVEEIDEDVSGQIVKVSISHDGEYATAVCLAAEEMNMHGTF
jgi:phosphopantetheine--protein transferase-like protein